MLIFIIAIAAIIVPVFVGILLALAAVRLDTAVTATNLAVENKDEGYNPAMTMGHQLPVAADKETQLQEARVLAARRAAALPRGANMRIGRLGHSNLRTASEDLENDPVTAVRIAAFHGWEGARTGVVAAGAPVAAPAAAPTAAAKIELAPGKDYPVIEITDDMSPAEKRKARIANAKAKSAARKAAKAAGATPTAAAPVVTTPAAAAPATAAATPDATSASIPKPDYIEITDGMSPDEKRKARIHNARARSQYNKALKAAGIDPKLS